MTDFEQQIDLFEAAMAIAVASAPNYLAQSSIAVSVIDAAKQRQERFLRLAEDSFACVNRLAELCGERAERLSKERFDQLIQEATTFVDEQWDHRTPPGDDVLLLSRDFFGEVDSPTDDETERISKARRHFSALAKQARREDLAEFFSPTK